MPMWISPDQYDFAMQWNAWMGTEERGTTQSTSLDSYIRCVDGIHVVAIALGEVDAYYYATFDWLATWLVVVGCPLPWDDDDGQPLIDSIEDLYRMLQGWHPKSDTFAGFVHQCTGWFLHDCTSHRWEEAARMLVWLRTASTYTPELRAWTEESAQQYFGFLTTREGVETERITQEAVVEEAKTSILNHEWSAP